VSEVWPVGTSKLASCHISSAFEAVLRSTLDRAGAEIIAGPIALLGARGKGTSLYTRDPDSNLLEFILYGE
jgi:hypothetical protein